MLKTLAITRCALTGYNPQLGSDIVESAQTALKDYVREAESLLHKEDEANADLARVLARESGRAYRVTQTAQ